MWITNKRGSDFQDRSEDFCHNMNGYRSEQEEHSATSTQICCLVEDNERCKRQAGNASYSKRIQKTVGQRKLKLSLDTSVSLHLKISFPSSTKLLFFENPILIVFACVLGKTYIHL